MVYSLDLVNNCGCNRQRKAISLVQKKSIYHWYIIVMIDGVLYVALVSQANENAARYPVAAKVAELLVKDIVSFTFFSFLLFYCDLSLETDFLK